MKKVTIPQVGPGIVIAVVVGLVLAIGGPANAAPVKEVASAHFGREVDATTHGNFCVEKSLDECQSGLNSGEAGGFKFPEGAAVGSNGNLYVADDANNRIEELTPTGDFVLALGKNVNGSGGHACGSAEAGKCRAAEEGSAPGEFRQPQDIAIDRSSHLVYVLDLINWRVQEFNEAGEFVLTFGKEVNATTKGNICTHASGNSCGSGVRASAGVSEPEAFNWAQGAGDLLAVGGPEHLLYVGDEHRVQEFDSEGKFKREILLTALSGVTGEKVRALAVDEAGDAYLAYGSGTALATIHKFDPAGLEVTMQCTAVKTTCWPLSIQPLTTASESFKVTGLAASATSKLAVDTSEKLNVNTEASEWGVLLDGSSGRTITNITIPVAGAGGMAFDEKEDLYLVGTFRQEVIAYEALDVAELLIGPASCAASVTEHESDVTLDCDLTGEVNPEGVADTRAWFEWGPNHTKTSEQVICTNSCGSVLVPVGALIEGVPPNASFLYNLAGFDANVEPPDEALTSETELLSTQLVPPKVVTLTTSALRQSSVLLSAQLNPENAATTYEFMYAPAASCPQIKGCSGALSTPTQQSRRYGVVRSVQEVAGLQPGTEYRYALVAESETDSGSEHQHGEAEGEFTTAARPVPRATTGSVSAVGTTSAIISGAVEPDGEAATYLFELAAGGTEPNYSIVASGPVRASETVASKTLSLTGLQPGARYVYRISVQYGSGAIPGSRAIGAPVEFVTQGVASSPPPPAVEMVPVPPIEFPKSCKHGYRLDKHGKCAKSPTKKKRHGKKKPSKRRKSLKGASKGRK